MVVPLERLPKIDSSNHQRGPILENVHVPLTCIIIQIHTSYISSFSLNRGCFICFGNAITNMGTGIYSTASRGRIQQSISLYKARPYLGQVWLLKCLSSRSSHCPMLHDFGVQIGTGVSNLAQLLANLGTSLKKVRVDQYSIMD